MFLTENNTVVYTSASDLSAASKCEFAFLRGLDARLGRIEALPPVEDAMLTRTGRLGDEHEERMLNRYRERGRVPDEDGPRQRSVPSRWTR
jgi:hypothetical protein